MKDLEIKKTGTAQVVNKGLSVKKNTPKKSIQKTVKKASQKKLCSDTVRTPWWKCHLMD